MAILRKYVTVTDILVYEVELTDEQLQLYKENEDEFMENIEYELNWEFKYDKVGDEGSEFELIN